MVINKHKVILKEWGKAVGNYKLPDITHLKNGSERIVVFNDSRIDNNYYVSNDDEVVHQPFVRIPNYDFYEIMKLKEALQDDIKYPSFIFKPQKAGFLTELIMVTLVSASILGILILLK